MIHTPDTDVFLSMLSMSNEIAGKLYMKTGTRRETRMINIADVKDQLDRKVSEQNIDYVLEALPGLHAFTGYDSASAFPGKGKIKSLKIMLKYEVFTNLFQSLRQEDDASKEICELSEQFPCTLYGHKEDHHVNAVRYKMYCAKRGKCEANQLPSCKSSLRKHVQRANYQCRIWREALTPMVNITDSVTHGWKLGDDGSLEIDWMDYQPAPDEVFLNEIISQCK